MANAVRRILLQRIANYFWEWDGEDKNAPKLSLSIDELRDIASMHTELCRLESENKHLKANESVKGDLISRSALIKELNGIYLDNLYDDKEDILEKAIGIVDHFPAPYQPKGE